MQRPAFIICFFLYIGCLQAQVRFETMVSPTRVVAGESFQVQYLVEEVSGADEFFQPDFKGFRLVTGPSVHAASSSNNKYVTRYKNYVFTLEVQKAGLIIVPGAEAKINGQLYKSNSVKLDVLTPEAAARLQAKPIANNEYYLRPGEDPYLKMKNNLYMKVQVNKKSCYVGEPVVATFKLYSLLDSKSDIVKNPGFYGFTVQDMVNLNDKQVAQEIINGRKFNVHTVRKVQLYPLQAGAFSIDVMEVVNKVRFSRSSVSKKTEQEITEGIYQQPEEAKASNVEEFENSMSTEPVSIIVKPVPEKNRPSDFDGATGRFSIDAQVENRQLARNEEGELLLTISGKGNFTQLAAPTVDLPVGIEGFEPVVKDSLDNTQAPLNGKRIFHYRFVSAKAGSYRLPAIHFSYFDPDSNSYKTISTADTQVTIENRERQVDRTTGKPQPPAAALPAINPAMAWLAVIVTLVITGAWWTWRKEQRRIKLMNAQPQPVAQVVFTPVDTVLQPATILLGGDDKMYYASLRTCIWNFLAERFQLSGSQMNKYNLRTVLQERRVEESLQQSLLDILEQCETGIFTSAEMEMDKHELLLHTRQVLEQLSLAAS